MSRPRRAPEPPPWLPRRGEARHAWRGLSRVFTGLGVMSELDGEALAIGCLEIQHALEAAGDPSRRREALTARRSALAALRKFTSPAALDAAAGDPEGETPPMTPTTGGPR